jgi:hypothetical protein
MKISLLFIDKLFINLFMLVESNKIQL